jgi:hypothetical protein
VRIAGKAVGEGADSLTGLQNSRPGGKVQVRVERNGWTRDLEVALGAFDTSWQAEEAVPRNLIRRQRDDSGEHDILEGHDVHSGAKSIEEEREGNPIHDGHWKSHDESEKGQHFEWHSSGENGEHGNGRVIERKFEFPGGEGKVHIRIEGDGDAHHLLERLHGMNLDADGKVLFRNGDELHEMHFGEGDGKGRAWTFRLGDAEDDDSEVIEDIIVVRPDGMAGGKAGGMVGGKGHNIRIGDEDFADMVEKIKAEVKSKGGESGSKRELRFGPQGSGDADLESMRKEIAELRGQIDGLRKLRDEMREVRELRTEIKTLIEKLERDK